MTLAQAVEEILRRADESFVDGSEDRARRMFYVALTRTLRDGKFLDTDAFGFVHERRFTFPDPQPNFANTCNISDFSLNDEVLAIRGDFYFDSEYDLTQDSYIVKATQEEVRKWGMTALRPRYDKKYYQAGEVFYFFPQNQWNGIAILAMVVTTPLQYATLTQLTGTVEIVPNPPNNSKVIGTDTQFLTEVEDGDIIEVNGNAYQVLNVEDDNNMDILEENITEPAGSTAFLVNSQSTNYWKDETNLLQYMSSAFLDSIIEMSAQLFRQEVIVNDG